MIKPEITDRLPSTVWENPAHVETLKRMWAEGDSYADIAAAIPGATRNAVCGKVHRLNLDGNRRRDARVRVRPSRTRTQVHSDLRHHAGVVRAVKRKSAPEPQAPLVISDDATDLAIPQEQRRTLVTLEDGQCHWIVGDPLTPFHFFCAAPAEKRVDRWGNEHFRPYCCEHHLRSIDSAGTLRSQKRSDEVSAAFKTDQPHMLNAAR